VTRYFQDRAAELDLSIVQAQGLLVIQANPGINVGALAATLSKDQASTSILVDKLMTLGLATRETDPSDRRRAQLFLTEQAEPLVAQLQAVRNDINRLVQEALGDERSLQLESLLADMLKAIEGSEANGTT
jgi:DNA-binding MarR family transcriptional regulator